jgi:hypothetical protein
MKRVEGIALETLLNATGEKLASESPEPKEALPTKLDLLLEKLEAAEADGKALLLEDEKVLRDRWLKIAVH